MNRYRDAFLATAHAPRQSLADDLPPTASGTRALGLAAALAAMFVLCGCGNLEPWVKPYEREALADPIMSFDSHPISTSYMHHVFEAREGARGALGGGGGGCGCN